MSARFSCCDPVGSFLSIGPSDILFTQNRTKALAELFRSPKPGTPSESQKESIVYVVALVVSGILRTYSDIRIGIHM